MIIQAVMLISPLKFKTRVINEEIDVEDKISKTFQV